MFLETLDYKYNFRGWLTSANKDYATNSGPNANNRIFKMMLFYDYGFAQNQLNSNIAGMVWRSRGDGEQKAYGFDYDNVNRLLKADFNQNNSGWNVSAGLDFSVCNLGYDANSNILTQKQKGWKITGSDFIDQLTYNYETSSNHLLNVIDASNDATTRLGDFRKSTLHLNSGNKTNSSTDYPSVSKAAIGAMMQRIDKPYGTDYAKDADYIQAVQSGGTIRQSDYGTSNDGL